MLGNRKREKSPGEGSSLYRGCVRSRKSQGGGTNGNQPKGTE